MLVGYETFIVIDSVNYTWKSLTHYIRLHIKGRYSMAQCIEKVDI